MEKKSGFHPIAVAFFVLGFLGSCVALKYFKEMGLIGFPVAFLWLLVRKTVVKCSACGIPIKEW